MSAGLVLEGVRISLKERPLIGPLDLAVAEGEAMTVMGPSGSGKSSLLAFLAGALPPALQGSGRVVLDGRDLAGVPTHRRRLGLLFQDPLLFPHLSVAENLLFALPREVRGAARAQAVSAALERIELAGFERRDPASLSGGQQARVALMRTLLARPRALLLDEPFSRLDLALRERIREMTFALAQAERLPILLVTHDPADAKAAGGPILDLTRAGMEPPGD